MQIWYFIVHQNCHCHHWQTHTLLPHSLFLTRRQRWVFFFFSPYAEDMRRQTGRCKLQYIKLAHHPSSSSSFFSVSGAPASDVPHDIHTPPGVKRHLAAFIKWLNILNSSLPHTPAVSPPGDCWSPRRYRFCQSHFPSAFVIPARVYELSIAVSECKVTDVPWAPLDGLSRAFNQCIFFLPPPIPLFSLFAPHSLQSHINLYCPDPWVMYMCQKKKKNSDSSSSYIIKYFTSRLSVYQGLWDRQCLGITKEEGVSVANNM